MLLLAGKILEFWEIIFHLLFNKLLIDKFLVSKYDFFR